MAMNVHLELTANGEAIEGESSVTSLDREGTIECISYRDVMTGSIDKTGLRTGKLVVEPIKIVKRIDKSSPLLFLALDAAQVVEGKFTFYRPSPTGDGTIEHYLTIHGLRGSISNISRSSPSTFDPSQANVPMLEEVAFVFDEIRVTYEGTGAEHVAEIRAERS